jgi:hypothetical protein
LRDASDSELIENGLDTGEFNSGVGFPIDFVFGSGSAGGSDAGRQLIA